MTINNLTATSRGHFTRFFGPYSKQNYLKQNGWRRIRTTLLHILGRMFFIDTKKFGLACLKNDRPICICTFKAILSIQCFASFVVSFVI